MSNVINIDAVPRYRLYTGVSIPMMGIGTFGSDKYSAEQVSEAVYGAIKAGYRLIDCAAVYQNEDKIGLVLKRVQQEKIVTREELFITSKVWNDKHDDVIEASKKSLRDLQLDYLDLYLIHWPFPNYHAPGCDGNSRNPNSKPFSIDEFINTWRQCEELVNMGLVKHIGMSNMTIPKLEAVLGLCHIRPAAIEMELHPSFQQQELYDYVVSHQMAPIAYCPIGSPSRPDRDRTKDDIVDMEMPEIVAIANAHGVHPAIICLKWAVQRGQIPIPFSVKEEQYINNLKCCTEDPLTEEEMELIRRADKNCRLIKGQVFLWPHSKGWEDLWDIKGVITK